MVNKHENETDGDEGQYVKKRERKKWQKMKATRKRRK